MEKQVSGRGTLGFLGFFFVCPFFFFLEVDDAKVWKVKHHIKEDKSGLLDPATF